MTCVVITGGGSGIGRATALRVAREGGVAVVLDRDGDTARQTVALVEAGGGRAAAYECDVGDEHAVRTTIAAAVENVGRIAGIVTSAGVFLAPDLGPAHEVSVADFVNVLRVNLVGTFAVIAASLPSLMDGGGSIVTIASTAAIRGHGQGAAYSASKGGVDALTRLLAVQYGPHGVRANCVCPGGVDTPMSGGVFATPDAQARARRMIPLGRYAKPDDIADVVVFLLSDDARYVTGQTLPVEGGGTIN